MLKTIVHLDDKAFMTILLSSVEAFPTKYRLGRSRSPNGEPKEGESFGLLFGQRVKKGTVEIRNVTLAVPSQIIYKRSSDGVSASIKHIDRIRELAEMFPVYQFLGTYHSHPWRSSALNWKKESIFDKEVFCKNTAADFSIQDSKTSLAAATIMNEDVLGMILGITCLKNRSTTNPEFIGNHMIYNCCGRYKYSLACYTTDLENYQFAPVGNLVCPTAAGMHHTDFDNLN